MDCRADDVVHTLPNGVTGEVLVRAPWLSQGYDRRWAVQHEARLTGAEGAVWHRTGDVGHVDDCELWIEGRTVHVVRSSTGPITPVPVEVAVQSIEGIDRCAAVGVGPAGCQQLVVVVEQPSAPEGLASSAITGLVRQRLDCSVAAVLSVEQLPVDIRHNTKIDRTLVATWAEAILAGRRTKRPW